MQFGAGVRGESDHITGVRWNFRLDQYDGDHRRSRNKRQLARGGRVRATTQFSTRLAPARLSVVASSASDAPVVMTSSITATASPDRGASQANAPRFAPQQRHSRMRGDDARDLERLVVSALALTLGR